MLNGARRKNSAEHTYWGFGLQRATWAPSPVPEEVTMSKSIPKIQKFMTTVPICINRTDTVAVAHKVMRDHDIRHLPVVDGDNLVGIISQRDLHLIETLKDVDAEKVAVEDAMTTNPYTVSPDADLDEVVAEMAEQKYGSALVVQNHKVVGVFTTVDAMRAFSELLKSRLTH
jgi:acetoin utilization protein AcuB